MRDKKERSKPKLKQERSTQFFFQEYTFELSQEVYFQKIINNLLREVFWSIKGFPMYFLYIDQ